MKRTRKRRGGSKSQMKGTLSTHLQVQLQLQRSNATSSSSRFQNLLDSESDKPHLNPSVLPPNDVVDVDDKDFILSQDFFCTPDYITPDNQNLLDGFYCNKENLPCPRSPEKQNTIKTKKRCQVALLSEGDSADVFSPILSDRQYMELQNDAFGIEEDKIEKPTLGGKRQNYVPQSAVALRCRVMPPPCIKNPYVMDSLNVDVDPFGNQRSKCAVFFPAIGRDGLSRYQTDFHEIQQIGTGNFSRVFKVLKRIDGCLYAVKHSTRQLHHDAERRKALMEVQALAALGFHENIVRYYSSWFENEQLYIQMELCDRSLSINKFLKPFTEREILEVLHQISKALKFAHERGIAHLDVKPDNIYVKNGAYKLGDFGCATLLDQSLPIEEGDARYLPQEILNENYNHLDKVDIFSLGAAIYELIRGSTLPESGFYNLKEGKLPLLPGHSLQFQNLLKGMIDIDPIRRPSAKELLENPVFDKIQRNVKA